MKHYHRLNPKKRDRTLDMTHNWFVWIYWMIAKKYPTRVCNNPYSWFDRKKNRWRGDRYNPDALCVNVE